MCLTVNSINNTERYIKRCYKSIIGGWPDFYKTSIVHAVIPGNGWLLPNNKFEKKFYLYDDADITIGVIHSWEQERSPLCVEKNQKYRREAYAIGHLATGTKRDIISRALYIPFCDRLPDRRQKTEEILNNIMQYKTRKEMIAALNIEFPFLKGWLDD